MAGTLTITTLNASSGVLQTQNGMTGICKAWVNFNGTGTVAIRDSFNVSSITDNGTGDYTVNFTTAMPDANYTAGANSGYSTTDNGMICSIFASATTAVAPTTSAFRVATSRRSDGTLLDVAYLTVSVFR
jgi:hypothetical protein